MERISRATTSIRLPCPSRLMAFGSAPTLIAALAPLASAQAPRAPGSDPTKSLARYVPAKHLGLYAEFDGLDAHAAAWRQSAAYKLLNDTSLGALLEDIATQLAERGLKSSSLRGKVTGAEVVAAVKLILRNGIALAYEAGAPPQPDRFVVVLRGGGRGMLRDLFGRLPAVAGNKATPVPAPVQKAGRTLAALGPDRVWWAEKDDLVIATANYADDVLTVLDGQQPERARPPDPHRALAGQGGFCADRSGLHGRGGAAGHAPGCGPTRPEWPRADRLSPGLPGRRDHGRAPRGRSRAALGDPGPPRRADVRQVVAAPTSCGPDGLHRPLGPAGRDLRPDRRADEGSGPAAADRIAQWEQNVRERLGLRLREDLSAYLGPKLVLYFQSAGQAEVEGSTRR